MHVDIRRQMIGYHLEQAGAESIVVCGDSRVEAALLPSSVAGVPLVNAGIGGATISLIGSEVPMIIGDYKLHLLVLSAGVNDAKIENRTTNSVSEFRSNIEAAIRKLAQNARKILLTSIPPVENGKPLGPRYYDGDLICRFNDEIASSAKRNGADFFDLAGAMTNENLELMAGMSIDGVHFSRTGYEIWRPALISAIERSLDTAN
ncbi:SGNH/GDSL hydrolase family protein [Bradyrhizobium valentinum]|nr:SGNH/GDSL hydrolase family protein [Bradyrhizobium valentinum]